MKRIGWRRSKRGGPASRHPPPSPHRCSPRSGRKTPRGLRVPRSAPGSRRTSGPAHACRRSCHHSRGRSAEWVAIASRSKQPSRSRGNSPPAAVRGQRLLAAAIATIGSRQLGRRPSPSGTASQTPLVEINIALGARRARRQHRRRVRQKCRLRQTAQPGAHPAVRHSKTPSSMLHTGPPLRATPHPRELNSE